MVMLGALRSLGIRWDEVDERTVIVHGDGGVLPESRRPICSWAMPAPRSVR